MPTHLHQKNNHIHSTMYFLEIITVCTIFLCFPCVQGFGGSSKHSIIGARQHYGIHVIEAKTNPEEEELNADFGEDDLQSAGVHLEDLAWRVERLRLEETNTRRFLKAKPRFLPYEEAQKWVQAWGGRWKCQKEWEDWIMDGEKRNSYIPSRPDEYYNSTGDWITWDDFLGTNKKDPKQQQ